MHEDGSELIPDDLHIPPEAVEAAAEATREAVRQYDTGASSVEPTNRVLAEVAIRTFLIALGAREERHGVEGGWAPGGRTSRDSAIAVEHYRPPERMRRIVTDWSPIPSEEG